MGHFCQTQYATRSLTKRAKRYAILFVFSFFSLRCGQNGKILNQISCFSWFVVLFTLFPYQPIWDVTNVNGIKICRLLHAVTENKSRCHCVTRAQPASRPRPALNSNSKFLIVLLRLMYDVSIEPLSQNRTKPESRSKRPTCAFNLDTPSTPRAFFSIPLNCCHAEKLEPVFFPPQLKSPGACGHFSGLCCVLHGLFAECLITGDNRINLKLMLQ